MHGGAARQGDACGPQGVVGRGDEHFVAIVAERLHAHVDQLADAVAGVDAFHGDVGQSLDLRVLHDRLARAEQAVAVGIAFAVGKLTAHVQDHLVDGAEAEGGRVTDIELEYVGTHLLHTVRFVDDGAADVVEDVIELGGFTQFAHGGSFRGTGVGGGSGFGWIGLPFRQGIALRVAWKGFARRRVLHGYRAFFACGRRVLRGGSFRSGLRSGGKPAFRNEEGAGEEGEGVGPGDALAAQVLADLALSQLPSLRLRDADQVDLLHLGFLHGLAQPACKNLMLHGRSNSSICICSSIWGSICNTKLKKSSITSKADSSTAGSKLN